MSNEAFSKYLEALSAEYRATLPQKFAEIDALWAGLAGGSEPPARMRELQRLLHTIAGSAKTFGLPALSASARTAESFLETWCEPAALPAAPGCAEFDALLASMRQSANTPR